MLNTSMHKRWSSLQEREREREKERENGSVKQDSAIKVKQVKWDLIFYSQNKSVHHLNMLMIDMIGTVKSKEGNHCVGTWRIFIQ
jgi:hypothetical protein